MRNTRKLKSVEKSTLGKTLTETGDICLPQKVVRCVVDSLCAYIFWAFLGHVGVEFVIDPLLSTTANHSSSKNKLKVLSAKAPDIKKVSFPFSQCSKQRGEITHSLRCYNLDQNLINKYQIKILYLIKHADRTATIS